MMTSASVIRALVVCACMVPMPAIAAIDDSSDFLDEHPTQKLALVVGNSNYERQNPIPSSDVDAINVAKALTQLGFSVTEAHDIKLAADFWHIWLLPFLDHVKENDFVVIYFSGHGLSFGGENFFAMTEFPEAIPESDITTYLVSLNSLQDLVAGRKPGLSLFLLDACRSIASNISTSQGDVKATDKGMVALKQSVANVGIWFSAKFGNVSKGRDAPGAMSYYTDALLRYLGVENREFGYVRRQTRTSVIADTGGAQEPWFSESLSAEIYLNPSKQIESDEKTAWQSRLDTRSREPVWRFTMEYPVSRYAAAAKRWLQQYDRATSRPTNTTKISPQVLDNAFNPTLPSMRVVVPRVDGPYGFKKFTSQSPLKTASMLPKSTIGDVLGQYDQVVVTRALAAKAVPDETAETIRTIASGATVDLKGITTDRVGNPWIEYSKDGTSGYLPANRALVGSADVGYSLGEIKVGPGSGLETLVEEKPIRDVIASFKANGRSISRVSIATSPTTDVHRQGRLQGRVAHVSYILHQLGIGRDEISTAVAAEVDTTSGGGSLGEQIRIRFFGH